MRSQLRTLSKLAADRVARHLVAAGRLVDDDPQAALVQARAARALGARVAVVRQAVGETAYAAGEWAEAIAELRTARRMTGDDSALPLLADAERALGRADRALRLAQSAEAQALPPAERVEMRIVEAGARRDLGQIDAALVTLQGPGLDRRTVQPWSARLWYAYADLLLALGREDEARDWFAAAASADQDGSTDADERILELDGVEVLSDDDEELAGVESADHPDQVDVDPLVQEARLEDAGWAGEDGPGLAGSAEDGELAGDDGPGIGGSAEDGESAGEDGPGLAGSAGDGESAGDDGPGAGGSAGDGELAGDDGRGVGGSAGDGGLAERGSAAQEDRGVGAGDAGPAAPAAPSFSGSAGPGDEEQSNGGVGPGRTRSAADPRAEASPEDASAGARPASAGQLPTSGPAPGDPLPGGRQPGVPAVAFSDGATDGIASASGAGTASGPGTASASGQSATGQSDGDRTVSGQSGSDRSGGPDQDQSGSSA